MNERPPEPNHIASLIDVVTKLNDVDALAGLVVVLAGKDKSFRVLAANNSEWSKEDMATAVRQSLKQMKQMKPVIEKPAKPKLILNS